MSTTEMTPSSPADGEMGTDTATGSTPAPSGLSVQVSEIEAVPAEANIKSPKRKHNTLGSALESAIASAPNAHASAHMLKQVLSNAVTLLGNNVEALMMDTGGIYVGDVVLHKPQGQGILIYPERDKDGRVEFRGEFVNGARNGIGTMTWTDGALYEGEWSNDKINGFAEETYTDKSTYSGQFSEELRHGIGVYNCPTTTREVGQNIWKTLLPDQFKEQKTVHGGVGGSSHAGNWDHGVCHGMGYRSVPNGKGVYGIYESGSLVRETSTEKQFQDDILEVVEHTNKIVEATRKLSERLRPLDPIAFFISSSVGSEPTPIPSPLPAEELAAEGANEDEESTAIQEAAEAAAAEAAAAEAAAAEAAAAEAAAAEAATAEAAAAEAAAAEAAAAEVAEAEAAEAAAAEAAAAEAAVAEAGVAETAAVEAAAAAAAAASTAAAVAAAVAAALAEARKEQTRVEVETSVIETQTDFKVEVEDPPRAELKDSDCQTDVFAEEKKEKEEPEEKEKEKEKSPVSQGIQTQQQGVQTEESEEQSEKKQRRSSVAQCAQTEPSSSPHASPREEKSEKKEDKRASVAQGVQTEAVEISEIGEEKNEKKQAMRVSVAQSVQTEAVESSEISEEKSETKQDMKILVARSAQTEAVASVGKGMQTVEMETQLTEPQLPQQPSPKQEAEAEVEVEAEAKAEVEVEAEAEAEVEVEVEAEAQDAEKELKTSKKGRRKTPLSPKPFGVVRAEEKAVAPASRKQLPPVLAPAKQQAQRTTPRRTASGSSNSGKSKKPGPFSGEELVEMALAADEMHLPMRALLGGVKPSKLGFHYSSMPLPPQKAGSPRTVSDGSPYKESPRFQAGRRVDGGGRGRKLSLQSDEYPEWDSGGVGQNPIHSPKVSEWKRVPSTSGDGGAAKRSPEALRGGGEDVHFPELARNNRRPSPPKQAWGASPRGEGKSGAGGRGRRLSVGKLNVLPMVAQSTVAVPRGPSAPANDPDSIWEEIQPIRQKFQMPERERGLLKAYFPDQYNRVCGPKAPIL